MWSGLEGSHIDGRYAVRHHIATGGMAAVYAGWDERVDRPVAIKVLRQFEETDRTAVARFRREAEAAAMLDHPNIVRVYDFFEDDAGRCFLIMELVEGPNLKQYLRRHGCLSLDQALAVAEHVCAALQAAHDRGFVHRDIKPQNILLDPSGRAKLTDFGIVHVGSGATLTTGGLVLGTADYIAPEQARGEQLGPASDIYALGVVLYEMLTGHVPFVGPTPMSVAMQHASAPVLPPSRLVSGLPRYVEAIVLRALRKAPAQRYRSARIMGIACHLARQALVDGERSRAEGERSQIEVAAPIPSLALAGAAVSGHSATGWPAHAEDARGAPAGALPDAPPTATSEDPMGDVGAEPSMLSARASESGAIGGPCHADPERTRASATMLGAKYIGFGAAVARDRAWRGLLVCGGAAVLGAGALAADLWLVIHGLAGPLPLP